MYKVILNDFPKICRLCLNKVVSINTYSKLNQYINIIHKITNVKIIENDCLPKQICKTCQENLDFINNFIETCNNNNDNLTRILQENKNSLNWPNIQIYNKIVIEQNTKNDGVQVATKNENDPNLSNNRNNDKIMEEKTNFFCFQCQKYFDTEEEFKNHMNDKYCMYSFGINCTVCNFLATCKEALKLHDNEYHKMGNKWKCDECNKLYAKKYNLQLHVTQTHKGNKPFKCLICNMNFVTQSTLNRHNKNVHSSETIKIFECYICEKSFNRKDNLYAHMKSNHINKQCKFLNTFEFHPDTFSCNICGKTFSIQSYLENHLKTHKFKPSKPPRMKLIKDGVKRFRFVTTSTLCSICGKYLTNKKSYYAHMKRKHSDIEYKPKIYPKKLKTDHYQCVICGKIITKLQNLKIHMRIHSGEKPYGCKFCNKKFTHHTTWSAHENIHTGNKPFQCVQCNKGFTHRSSLRKHLRSSVHKMEDGNEEITID